MAERYHIQELTTKGAGFPRIIPAGLKMVRSDDCFHELSFYHRIAIMLAT